MAKTYTYEWAIGKWADRAKLKYQPIDAIIDGKVVVNFKKASSWGDLLSAKTPYKVEDTENGVIYMTYSSSDTAAIIKITEG